MKTRTTNTQGFTIIELLIATTIFSIILLLLTVGILQIGNRYYKTTLQSRTQTAARNIIDEVSRGIQFSGVAPNIDQSAHPNAYCINGTQYSTRRMVTITGTQHALVAQTSASCTSPSIALFTNPLPAGARDLLTERMRLQKFSIVSTATPDTYLITVRVISGEDNLLENPADPDTACRTNSTSHFCAVSELSTTVQKRVH